MDPLHVKNYVVVLPIFYNFWGWRTPNAATYSSFYHLWPLSKPLDFPGRSQTTVHSAWAAGTPLETLLKAWKEGQVIPTPPFQWEGLQPAGGIALWTSSPSGMGELSTKFPSPSFWSIFHGANLLECELPREGAWLCLLSKSEPHTS